MFELQSSYQPQWDQPQAIKSIVRGFSSNGNDKKRQMTLLWATWTGKTFTMANVIQQIQKPTLILSHNKTLAAQLATECKYFFPKNAVHYFVSYFDYYQPESYLPEKGMFIEKEATINKEIEMFRLSTMASLLSREDVIVVSSVSALYGLWSKEEFAQRTCFFRVGERYNLKEVRARLLAMQYKPVHSAIEQGMFDIQGERVDIYPSTEKTVYRLLFNDDNLELIQIKDATTLTVIENTDRIMVWPATQYLQDMDSVEIVLKQIEEEMEERVKHFESKWMLVEAQRIRKRVMYDIRMIKENGFVNGIENYSPYFEKRLDGTPPNTLFDYFPDDFLLIIDESHMTVPQFRGMPSWDRSRKETLVEHGFRLPSALQHRPIGFDELTYKVGWTWRTEQLHESIQEKQKKDTKTLFVSATPAPYELRMSQEIVQQIIRPTGLLDPITYIYPKSWTYDPLLSSLDTLLDKEPELKPFLESLSLDVDSKTFT
jgi:excinuclease ABC subunit B